MRKTLLCLLASMSLFFISCEKESVDDPKTPIKVEFINQSLETELNELPLRFRVTPADAEIEINELESIGSMPNSSYTSDSDYVSLGDPTASSLVIESLEDAGDGEYVLHTKLYFNDEPVVMKDEHMYSYTWSNVSFELKSGEKSNTMKVVLKQDRK